MKERLPLTHVAIRYKGTIYSLPAPNRHHHVLSHIREVTGETHIDVESSDDEGFLDSSGNYLRRKPALVNAIMNNQIKDESKLTGGNRYGLFSEDVW